MTHFQIAVSAIVLAVALGLAGVWAFQTYGIYRFDQTVQTPEALGLAGVKAVAFRSEDGAPLQAWLAPPAPGKKILISFYGNFSAIGPSLQRLAPLIADGTGIAMLQYRGAGGQPGRPSEENFARDARALYDQLDALAGQTIPPARRVLHGYSLGSGVATRLATERSFAGLVLEAAIPRLCLYFQRRYHGVPFCHLMWAERYDSLNRIGAVAVPKLFVHGAQDAEIPPDWGRQLFAAAKGAKRFIEIPGAGHTDLAQHGLIPALRDFLAKLPD